MSFPQRDFKERSFVHIIQESEGVRYQEAAMEVFSSREETLQQDVFGLQLTLPPPPAISLLSQGTE